MNFTSSQREAILCRGGSVLVSAGAGSGKTRVLTERLMAYIDPQDGQTPPESIERFLVITFTRAAAGELRARIAAAITERLRSDPQNAHLRLQLLKCRSAHIGTIHSFCADLLRRNADALGISPAFRILEEERGERLRSQTLDRVMEKSYEDTDEDFLRLADSVGAGRDDRRLTDLVLKLHGEMQSHARPDLWAQEQIDELSRLPSSVADTGWGRELLQQAREETAFHLEQMCASLDDMLTDETVCRAYSDSFSETVRAMRRLQDALGQDWNAAAACFPIPFPRLGPVRKNAGEALTKELRTRRDACKKAMEKLGNVFGDDEAAVLGDLHRTATAMCALLRLALKLDQEFAAAKRRQDLMDFGDLEHFALRLLQNEDGTPTETAAALSEMSREGGNLFFVGDVKQAIYRFRLADPGIFTEKSRRFGEHENTRGERLIRLRENFRSHRAVLDAVNAVFSRCMTRKLGDIDYCGAEELIPGRTEDTPTEKPELLIIPYGESELGALESEAKQVAREIRRLMNSCRVPDGEGESRPLRYGDIAILLRTANTVGAEFRQALLGEGIPVAAGFGGDFYCSTEVTAVLSMLLLLDNPHQDIPLLSLLRTPCFGFDADRLSLIRALRPDADFYTALCASDDPETVRFLELFRRLRNEAPDCGAPALLERITEELDLYALCSAMPDAERRLAHLADLFSMAESFSRSGEYGLHRFVMYMKNMRDRDREPAGCARSGDAVSILSIHRSKGLEYPVVFCSGLGRSFNRQDLQSAVLIHPVLGLGPKCSDIERRLEYPTAARLAIAKTLKRESLSEEMRLLYVAMTRARERLILTAAVQSPDKLLENAERMLRFPVIPAQLLQDAQYPLPWVLPAAVEGRELSLRICKPEDFEQERSGDAAAAAAEADESLVRTTEENLAWVYPHAGAESLPSKITATELKARQEEDPDAVPLTHAAAGAGEDFLPPDLLGRRLSAAQRGTAMHVLLQQIDFRKTESVEAIRGEILRLTEQEFLSPEEARTLDPAAVCAFFRSPLGERILRADFCRREFRFSLLVPAGEVLPVSDGAPSPEDEKILLQGSVDCCFEEDGALVVVDYKTDRAEGEDEIRQRAAYYRIQLDTYARALERIFGLPVREKILYFLRSGRKVTL